MVIGCGIDIEEVNRFSKYAEGDSVFIRLVEDVFTQKEIEINNRITGKPSFSLGFSCKEAVFKALGVSWLNSDIHWKDIELIFSGDDINKYEIRLNGFANDLFSGKNGKMIQSEFELIEDHIIFKVILTD